MCVCVCVYNKLMMSREIGANLGKKNLKPVLIFFEHQFLVKHKIVQVQYLPYPKLFSSVQLFSCFSNEKFKQDLDGVESI